MEISVNNISIKSTKVNPFENAWKIKDVLLLLEYYSSNHVIVLGGDVLNDQFKHTYDNWYYNLDNLENLESNSIKSIAIAKEYVEQYIKHNGNNYYVVLVTQGTVSVKPQKTGDGSVTQGTVL